MKEFWTYTAARLGLFLACYAVVFGVCVLVGGLPVPLLWPLLVAAVASSLLSVVLLRGLRTRFNDSVQARASRMATRP